MKILQINTYTYIHIQNASAEETYCLGKYFAVASVHTDVLFMFSNAYRKQLTKDYLSLDGFHLKYSPTDKNFPTNFKHFKTIYQTHWQIIIRILERTILFFDIVSHIALKYYKLNWNLERKLFQNLNESFKVLKENQIIFFLPRSTKCKKWLDIENPGWKVKLILFHGVYTQKCYTFQPNFKRFHEYTEDRINGVYLCLGYGWRVWKWKLHNIMPNERENSLIAQN